jgi:hypothetical protein
MRVLGPLMVITLYLLVALHVYAYFVYIVGVLFKRLGKFSAIGWVAIGLIILFNILYNHCLAVIIKPGSPKDLRNVEALRDIYKRRTNRKSVKANLEDDRFEGLSTDVKQLLKYRHKTMSDTMFVEKHCRHCNEVKPARTHHCSVC